MPVGPSITQTMPRGSAAAAGVDPAGVLAWLDELDATPDIEMHSVMIIRHGRVVADGWWSPYRPDLPHLLYSLSKSFTATAAGIAAWEGLLDLDATVLSYFPELDAEVTHPWSRSMRVRHVAAMASGHLSETLDQAVTLDPAEPVRGFLLIPPDREPGTVFAYNQPCTYSLAAIVQRVTGQPLTEYLRPRLFDPLGIGRVGWQQHPPGRDLGFTGLHATTDAIARLGLLYLNRGVWDGTRVLPEKWVAEATRKQVSNPGEPQPDWRQGYGFQFWMARHGYRGDGAYGQFCLVLPEQDAVIATTAATENMQGVLDATWAHLLPAMTNAAADQSPAAEPSPAAEQLSARLAHLELPGFAAEAGPVPPDSSDSATSHEAGWAGVPLSPVGGRCEAQPSLNEVVLRPDGAEWRLNLVEETGELSVRVGGRAWQTNLNETGNGRSGVALAVSGGWTDAVTFGAEVIFLETPHRLSLTCSLTERSFRATWVTVPLRGGHLAELRMPRRLPADGS